MKIKLYTKAYYEAVDQAKAEAAKTGEDRYVVETVYGVFVGSKAEFGGCVNGMARTLVRSRGTVERLSL